jgi:hypothetical protein
MADMANAKRLANPHAKHLAVLQINNVLIRRIDKKQDCTAQLSRAAGRQFFFAKGV